MDRFKFDDKEIHKSFYNSSRKIELLVIDGSLSSYSVKTQEVLRRIGSSVKQMELCNFIIGFKGLQTLELMPNMETLKLESIQSEKYQMPVDFHLNLPNLRKLTITECNFKVIEFFHHLDDDILDELVVSRCKRDARLPEGKLFENQRNIKTSLSN
jgi:hypothetical protein